MKTTVLCCVIAFFVMATSQCDVPPPPDGGICDIECGPTKDSLTEQINLVADSLNQYWIDSISRIENHVPPKYNFDVCFHIMYPGNRPDTTYAKDCQFAVDEWNRSELGDCVDLSIKSIDYKPESRTLQDYNDNLGYARRVADIDWNSDQKCIHAYVLRSDNNLLGFAYLIGNYDSNLEIRGDYNSLWCAYEGIRFNSAFTHELGHMLGLDHDFNTPRGYMSYFPHANEWTSDEMTIALRNASVTRQYLHK